MEKISLYNLAQMVHASKPAPAREDIQIYYCSPEVVETESGYEVGKGIQHGESDEEVNGGGL